MEGKILPDESVNIIFLVNLGHGMFLIVKIKPEAGGIANPGYGGTTLQEVNAIYII